jgi:hypothetical protein
MSAVTVLSYTVLLVTHALVVYCVHAAAATHSDSMHALAYMHIMIEPITAVHCLTV